MATRQDAPVGEAAMLVVGGRGAAKDRKYRVVLLLDKLIFAYKIRNTEAIGIDFRHDSGPGER